MPNGEMMTNGPISAIKTRDKMSIQKVGLVATVTAVALVALIAVSPIHANAQQPALGAVAPPPQGKTLGQKVKALVAEITPDRIKRDLEYRKASALFPDFCKHWEKDLQDREQNNLSKLKFVPKDGYQTTTYTGYGQISGCESHQSRDGYSIGKITYEEFVYYLVGKSEDEARRALPKTVSDTHTTEIFRWDNGKWFY
jgi:hypothetical protein